MKTVVSVCSARPNFVKVAAVHHALEEAADAAFRHVIVHTGQHYDPLFSDIFFQELQLPDPAYNLGIKGGDRDQVIHDTEAAFSAILPEMKPDIVLVYGDVNGALAAARAAKKYGCKIGHVEAGLRSFDPSMPEEHNRIEIDQLADILFCTEPSALKNLDNEGVTGRQYLVGNTMIDTLVRMMPSIDAAALPEDLPARYAIVTIHRPSNVDDPAALKRTVDTLIKLAAHIDILLPLHHRFKDALVAANLLDELSAAAHVLPPQGYFEFLKLVKGAAFIVTDSGGIQEEATFLQKRCYTLRKSTERPITMESGSNVLVDMESDEGRERLIAMAAENTAAEITVPELWDGQTGKRITAALEEILSA